MNLLYRKFTVPTVPTVPQQTFNPASQILSLGQWPGQWPNLNCPNCSAAVPPRIAPAPGRLALGGTRLARRIARQSPGNRDFVCISAQIAAQTRDFCAFQTDGL